MRRLPRSLRSTTFLIMLLASPPAVRAGEPAVVFSRDVLPILSENCFRCHGPDEKDRKAKLRLDTEGGARKVVVPGKSGESELYRRVSAAAAGEVMPPPKANRRLTDAQKDVLRRWIDQGAAWGKHWAYVTPRRPTPPVSPPSQGGEAVSPPLAKGGIQGGWVHNAIDCFVLARLEKEGLAPSPEAGKETLLRRVTLDLTGLPPTLHEIDTFLADRRPDAYERLVDRLLASERYGEHMAADWLDAARFADTNGYQNDFNRSMWLWRDWVIDAYNRNVPFDRFVVEQIAGDLLPGATLRQKIASGFNRNNRTVTEAGSIDEEWRVENAVDRVETTAAVFLGLTMGCGRCHDHKYDPISQQEFYRFFAFFNSVNEPGVYTEKRGNTPPVVAVPSSQDEARLKRFESDIAAAQADVRAEERDLPAAQARWEQRVRSAEVRTPRLGFDFRASAVAAELRALVHARLRDVLATPGGRRPANQQEALSRYFRMYFAGELRAAEQRLAQLRKEKDTFEKQIPTVMVMQDRPKPRDTYLLKRGRYDTPDKSRKLGPGVPACLSPLPPDAPANRLGLARWLVDPANPLTARVTVNRIWQHHFGTGLVKTAEDFGVRGEPPSHPELLDWLASELVRTGWDMKALHRLIVTSAAYRQSSHVTPDLLKKDPENRLLARGPRLRLSAEAVRDNALAASGLLVEKVGGPSVKPYQPAGLWEELAGGAGEGPYVQDRGPNLYRRSLYVYRKRTVPHPVLATFDAPGREICQVKRQRTNTPLQSLALLNDVTYVEAARQLAQRMLSEGGSADEDRLAYAFRRATGRRPGAEELHVLLRGLERYRRSYHGNAAAAKEYVRHGASPVDVRFDPAELAAHAAVASIILNLDEMVTRE